MSLSLFAAVHAMGINLPQELPQASQPVFTFLVIAGLIICQFILMGIRVGIEQRALLALREANEGLLKAHLHLASLDAGFGFSPQAWEKLKREKAALEYALSLRLDDSDLEDEAEEGTSRARRAF